MEDFGNDPLLSIVLEADDPLVEEVVEDRFKARGDLPLFLIALGTGGGRLKVLLGL